MRMRVGRGWVALAIAVAAVDVAVVHQISRSIVVDATTAMVVLLATAFVSIDGDHHILGGPPPGNGRHLPGAGAP